MPHVIAPWNDGNDALPFKDLHSLGDVDAGRQRRHRGRSPPVSSRRRIIIDHDEESQSDEDTVVIVAITSPSQPSVSSSQLTCLVCPFIAQRIHCRLIVVFFNGGSLWCHRAPFLSRYLPASPECRRSLLPIRVVHALVVESAPRRHRELHTLTKPSSRYH